jgi:signal transduction histidine kinase
MRLVTTADSERRRIERDLHDGAQQHLVALAVNARLARDAVKDDPDGAADLLEQLSVDLRTAVQEVRALAHGIYPPLLIDSGVPAALRAAAQRSPLPVEVHADVDRFAPESEAAVYFCCLEALQNAAKHSPEATVVVDLRTETGPVAGAGRAAGAAAGEAAGTGGPPERVRFTVADDGCGFDPATTPPGHGLQNMADRAGALGGAVEWRAVPGEGTTIDGWVPAGTRT